MLLILTSLHDLTADYLIVRLQERKLPHLRLNAEQLGNLPVSLALDGFTASRVLTDAGGETHDLSAVRSVWYRRVIDPQPAMTVEPAAQRFIAGELRHLWSGMVLDASVKWVNPIECVQVAEHKLWQLRLAQRVGFNIPATLVSSDPRQLRAFVERTGAAITKPIFHGLYVENHQSYAIYTRRIRLEDLADDGDIALCPVFLQAEIRRASDLRVTFVGERYFAVRITGDDAHMVDWRVPGHRLNQVALPCLPDGIERRCRQLMEALGLSYGAFDFIETPTGEWVFLEINPTGEWAWLEDQLGLPIRDAFVDLLYQERT